MWAGKFAFYQGLEESGRLAAKDKMPDIVEAEWLYSAFMELSTCRTYTPAGPAQIPATAVWEWQDRYNGPEWLPDAIRIIDRQFLESSNGGNSRETHH